jgi:hypothetical protein
VELLEFQRQSVQWALERETTPGGVQSFLWVKLPSVAEPSGSPVTTLSAGNGAESCTTANGQSSWDRELHSRTSESHSKRGSILSRGTLVVVSVRLIGCYQYGYSHMHGYIAHRIPSLLTVSRFTRRPVDRRGEIKVEGSRLSVSVPWSKSQTRSRTARQELHCRDNIPGACFRRDIPR